MSNITKLKLIYAFSSLYFFHPIITLFYFSRGLSLFQVLTLEAVLGAAIVVLEIPAGVVADRQGRKLPLCVLLCCSAVVGIWNSVASSYSEFLLIQIVLGVGIAFGSRAIESLVYESLEEEGRESEMARAWGAIKGYSLLARVVAVIAGGYVAKAHNPESYPQLFLFYAGGVAIAFLIAFWIKEPRHFRKTTSRSFFRAFEESKVELLRNPMIRRIVFLTLATDPFVQVIGFLFPPYFLIARVPIEWWGMVMALGNLLAASCMVYAHTLERTFGENRA